MTQPRLALIAAVARNGVIGAGGAMPWRLSTDLQRFKRLTLGKPIIMGRKTFASIGKPLAGRTNIVLTHHPDMPHEGVTITSTLESAIEVAANQLCDEILVIGGGQLYAAAIERADRLYITHVEASPPGDTYFPPIDSAVWEAGPEEQLPAGGRDTAATTFIIYQRIRPLAVR